MKLFLPTFILALWALIATAIAFPPPSPSVPQPDPSVASPLSDRQNGPLTVPGNTNNADRGHGTCHMHVVINNKCCQQWSVGTTKHLTYAWFSFIRDAAENNIPEVDQYIGKWYLQSTRCGGLEDGDVWRMETWPLSWKWYEWHDNSDGSYHMKMTFSFNGFEWDEVSENAR